MLTVIINAYSYMKSILLNDDSLLSKLFLKIVVAQKPVKTTHHKSVKQRLKVRIEQLGNNPRETSLTIIHDLEQIAQDHPQYHWLIIDTLTTFVRENSPYMLQLELISNPLAKVPTDIQAALAVIVRRDAKKDPKDKQLDLSHTDMRGANLNSANLEDTNLYLANLSEANLSGANLKGAILSAANLCGANLAGANLEGAILSAANLEKANLSGANLYQANLYLASLHEAILDNAIFDGANIREAKFSE
ncbi:pentapeptide repeat-containing protein [Komarekiella sp. 'clone 1']|uniref:Pentapeptide repeat-containing protein n=1 Tax=Komarekiella delphini-convector SJRDD-AB1 TaxID=2593771 RepID=A0AA40T1X1_9NOST|nr:pentapeptide repeat-containing protein [Komarekiella delphini-convector]MBD6619399.1 pentapeptide repeat-containing protein [Komarekiella delphini-convector SJRDD-AB1]